MNIFAKKLLDWVGPLAINYAMRAITGDKVKEWMAKGADELTEAIGKAFDLLAEKVEGTDNKVDDAALEAAREIVTGMVAAVVSSGSALDLVEMAAEALVALAKRTDNELDDTLAERFLDAVREAKD